MANKDTAVVVSNLVKSFKIPTEASSGLKQKIINALQGKRGYRVFTPLKGMSFEIKKGDFLGIVGRNGSGKSTLLKLIANIYHPTEGSVTVDGKLIPFIELGVGFNPDLTGRENVFLNGALLGFSHKEMEAMYDDIVEFAEIGDFMDEKLKNYSSGMQVRLAFSIAIRADGDILLLDEVLAVGDEAFQRKCNEYFKTLKKNKKTVILVTHSMDNVRKFCNRAIMIRDGEIVAEGNPEKVADTYSLENLSSRQEEAKIDTSEDKESKSIKPYLHAEIKSKKMLKNSDTLNIDIVYKNITKDPVFIKTVVFYQGTVLMVANEKIIHKTITNDLKKHSLEYKLPLNAFNNGEYTITVLLVDEKTNVNTADIGYNNELVFRVSNVETGSKVGGAMKNTGTFKLLDK